MVISIQQRSELAWAQRETIPFPTFRLTVSSTDGGGRQYKAPLYWAEVASPIDGEIAHLLHPALYVDVGANYGFTCLIQHRVNPAAAIVAIEPDPMLHQFIEHNLRDNGCTRYSVVSAICSDTSGTASMSLNPGFSQDNRVKKADASWSDIPVPSVTLDMILQGADASLPVLIKVDVQGYEQQVLRGGEAFLTHNQRWMMKAEFGPDWLQSQGTDSVSLLRDLVRDYNVSELPQRPRFRHDTLASILSQQIRPGDEAEFVRYLEQKAPGKRGSCDLLVWPRSLAA